MGLNKWTRHLYQPGLPLGEDGKRVTGSTKHLSLARKAAGEGMVLLKNDNNVLPLKKGSKVVLLGKGTIDYVRGGGGSGRVTVAFERNIYDGLKEKELEGKVSLFNPLVDFYKDYVKSQYDLGYDPGMIEEVSVPKNLIDEAKAFSNTAIISISRFSGEGWDRKPTSEHYDANWDEEIKLSNRQLELFPNTDYMLTAKERELVDIAKNSFKNIIVVINSGGIIETGWIKNDSKISAGIFAWQGGIEGGDALADILVGDINPSGRLVDSFADSLDDYPSTYNFHDSNDYVEYTDDIYIGYRYFETIKDQKKKVIYPFGYGLSYTKFKKEFASYKENASSITVSVNITNIGNTSGKDVVMVYYSAPNGLLGKPKYELAGFAKTKDLAINESVVVNIEFSKMTMASFDDLGKIEKSAWVLEKGIYEFFIGGSVDELMKISNTFVLDNDLVLERLSSLVSPSKLSERMLSDGTMEKMPQFEGKKMHSILPHISTKEAEGVMPSERAMPTRFYFENKDIMLIDVVNGKNTLDEFMAQMSIEDMIHLLGGQRNVGVSNTFGIGNMPEYGIPEVTTADGPAGLRIMPWVGVYTTAWPCSTMLACTMNKDIAYLVGEAVAKEIKENNIGIWLAPAVNIHRSPMCGRNFEYYSEDPVIAGVIGSSVVSGVQSQNIAATVKHFAANNKETNRKSSDSIVSERALREIYLKPFEIIVKDAHPMCIMTSYNMINGIQASENEELINGILRKEWGFDGLVMSDWWTQGEHYLEAKAGNDLKMGNGYPDRVLYAYNNGEITKDEIYLAAKNVLKLILKME